MLVDNDPIYRTIHMTYVAKTFVGAVDVGKLASVCSRSSQLMSARARGGGRASAASAVVRRAPPHLVSARNKDHTNRGPLTEQIKVHKDQSNDNHDRKRNR